MSEANSENTKEVLVVVSKLKNYIRSASGFNTSSSVVDVLSDLIRTACDKAIENARQDGRKTVMDRDFTATTGATTSTTTSTMTGSSAAA